MTVFELWDDDAFPALATRAVQLARDAGALTMLAWRGIEREAREIVDAALDSATARGEGRVLALAGYAAAVLYNGLGRFEQAADGAERATEWSRRRRARAARRSPPRHSIDSRGALVPRAPTGPSGCWHVHGRS